MGQAKNRGTREQREQKAIAAKRAELPAEVECNNCHATLIDIHPMDVRGMPGMRKAGGALCGTCGHQTWVLDGTPEGLALFRRFLDEEHGSNAVSSGTARL